jgi:uncharacterized protein
LLCTAGNIGNAKVTGELFRFRSSKMGQRLGVDAGELARFCRQRGIRRLSLFGSRLRQTNRQDSDVDLLVEFESDAAPTLLDMATMEAELSALLGGLKVDLRTPQDLSRYFRDAVVREAQEQYVAA